MTPSSNTDFLFRGLQLHNLHFGTAICLAPCQQGWQYGTRVITSLAYSILARPMPYCWESGVNWYFWGVWLTHPTLAPSWFKKKKSVALPFPKATVNKRRRSTPKGTWQVLWLAFSFLFFFPMTLGRFGH